MTIAPSCSNCHFWLNVPGGYSHYQGYCMRVFDHTGLRPFKGSGDCCSEHEPIEVNKVTYTDGHAKDCAYHQDQYPWECTCGRSA